jgi:hypothetical protein
VGWRSSKLLGFSRWVRSIERAEFSEDVHDRLVHRTYAAPDHESGFSATLPRVWDSYVKDNVGQHLHARRRPVQFEGRDWRVVLEVPDASIEVDVLVRGKPERSNSVSSGTAARTRMVRCLSALSSS